MPAETATPAGHAAADPGFGIYVHWPFCAAKCPYCDFNSHVRRQIDQTRYAAALTAELRHMAALSPGLTVSSVFFGGGTPSLMNPDVVATVLDTISTAWPAADDLEVTLEANPSSVEADRFRDYRSVGVNRVSIGVQALDDESLRFLGRLHDTAEALAAIETARATFDRMSFDLIYARPRQTTTAWRDELDAACRMAADHLSLYQLTIEPDTPFADLHARGRLPVPGEDLSRDLYDVTLDVTDRHGLPAYEISNHARQGAESRHNLLYWRCGQWAGVGPGAHGRLAAGDTRTALSTIRKPEDWLDAVERDGHGVQDRQPLARDETADEYLVMGLRLREGIDPARYQALAGYPLAAERLDDLAGYGLIETLPDGRIRATRSGFAVLNAVVADLASAPPAA